MGDNAPSFKAGLAGPVGFDAPNGCSAPAGGRLEEPWPLRALAGVPARLRGRPRPPSTDMIGIQRLWSRAMAEGSNQASTKDEEPTEAVVRQFRDWLIPASLFVGIGASIVLFTFSLEDLTALAIAAACLALASLLTFLLSVLWAFTRLESIEILGFPAQRTLHVYFLACLGIVLLDGSLVALAFWKSTRLGFGFLTMSLIALAMLVLLARASVGLENRSKAS